MHVNDYFDCIFCIYLERRKENWINPDTGITVNGRFAQVQQEFEKHGIKVEFVPGIDGRTLNIGRMVSSDKTVVSRGDLGCTLSHLKVAKIAKERGLKNYCVFEDDVEFSPTFSEQFTGYIEQVPEEWDMLYFGGNHDIPCEMISDNVARIFRTFTTHAFAARSNMFQSLIDVLSPENEKVDICISSLHAKSNSYVFRPHLAWQRAGFSDILEKEDYYQHLKK